jgi:hypothetical protein
VKRALGFGCLALILAGCDRTETIADRPKAPSAPSARCDPASLGYITTRSGLDWLGKAVDASNALLSQQGQFQLQLIDQNPAAADSRIPVWPVASRGLTPMETAFVPNGCNSVFIQTVALAQRVRDWEGDGATGFTIATADIATWILLHETGHIRDAVSGQLEPAPAVRGINFSNTQQKRRELSADAYAARLITVAGADQPYAAFLAGMGVRMSLSQLSWNLQRDRQLTLFGSSVLATPGAFGDVGDTHPNLELRVLITRVLIDDSDESRALLDEFVATRERAADQTPQVIYDAAKP